VTRPADPAPARRDGPLPSGTVTFLFTDIEGSTRLLAALGDAYEGVLGEHRRRIRSAVAAAGGYEISTEGDAFFLVFDTPSAAVGAAVQAQRALAEPWPDGVMVTVRMGIHTGEAILAADDYIGLEVHRAARIGAAAHGGQVIISSATTSLVEERLPAGVALRDLGEHSLKDIARHERLTQLVIDGLPAEFPPPRTLDATPNNLPIQLTSFVGRTALLADATRLLERTRLLTLTGPGGTGKTRLALELAADAAAQFSDGVYFVPLSAISDPLLLAPTIAATAGVPHTGSRPPLEQLMDALRARRTLLVLDNFEQLLGAGPAVAELLRGTDVLKILVTSRSVLRVSGEQELPVPPLGLPDPGAIRGAASLAQFDAVRLFIERAVAARPDFAVTNENAPAVAEITARLDGLPLAIELAAARLRFLSPQAILARLGDRLGLLSGGARDLPARQQTLRAAIAWSYDLLDSGQRDLFERLGVFMGGWSLEAAEAVTRDELPSAVEVFDGLDLLAQQSLIRSYEDSHGDSRFMMLETIHAFSAERFEARPDAAEIRRRHAAWYTTRATAASAALTSGSRAAALVRFEDDQGNLRSALDWLTSHDVPMAARLAADMWRFWQARGYLLEGRARIEAVLAADDRSPALAAGRRRELLSAGGGIAYWQADFVATHRHYAEALNLARASGVRKEVADALYDFSFAPSPPRDMAEWQAILAVEAPPVLEEAMAIYREIGDRAGIARSLWARSENDYFGGEFSRAVAALEEALTIFRELGDRFQISWSLHSIGLAQTVLGNFDAARQALHEAMTVFIEDGDVSGMTLCLVDVAGLEWKQGRVDRAFRFAGAADVSARRTGTGLAGFSSQIGSFATVPQEPPVDSEHHAAWDEGVRLSLETAAAEALASLEPARPDPARDDR